VLGPFQVEKHPLTLHPKDAKPDAGSERAGPVGWWKLDETSGSTVANAAGNKLIGKLHGKPSWTPDAGIRGGALELDGRRDWVEFADTSNLDFRGGLTVAVWIKTHAGDKSPGTLLAKGEGFTRSGTVPATSVPFQSATPFSVPISIVSPTARSTVTAPSGRPSSRVTRLQAVPSALSRLTPWSMVPIQSRPERSNSSAVSALLASWSACASILSKPVSRQRRSAISSQ
jgi:hypothetical protein